MRIELLVIIEDHMLEYWPRLQSAEDGNKSWVDTVHG